MQLGTFRRRSWQLLVLWSLRAFAVKQRGGNANGAYSQNARADGRSQFRALFEQRLPRATTWIVGLLRKGGAALADLIGQRNPVLVGSSASLLLEHLGPGHNWF
ncbi:uncharacterized protein P884DRAFT_133520 [Thermothelomyces heterothallicus CBS 202.75]|uniref:uncharacterized protein n=1 Tax=Thermothelomyces heterothallicus CBS 202.75 TaxID=1149848 RepID=UPI003743FB0A